MEEELTGSRSKKAVFKTWEEEPIETVELLMLPNMLVVWPMEVIAAPGFIIIWVGTGVSFRALNWMVIRLPSPVG